MARNPFKKNPDTNFKDIKKLDKKAAKEQVEQLREAIDYHDYRYYTKNDPVISDRAYDTLFKRLQDLEKEFPDLQSPNSPTKRVGAEPVDELKKKKHTRPMLSLDSALEKSEIEDFKDYVDRHLDDETEYVLEPKLDGLSVKVVYENGSFDYGATRGDGTTGEDISENLKTIGSLPLQLQHDGEIPQKLAVRGEVLMSRSGFQEINKKRVNEGKEPFANPRNAAAGTVRQLDPKNVADKPLDIFFYELLLADDWEVHSHWEVLNQFPKWGLKTHPLNNKVKSMRDAVKYHQKLTDERDDMDYEIDGMVIKVDGFSQRETLGTRERNPRWAMAWKFPPKKEMTRLRDIVVQVGRTGMLTPVALLDPVDIGGVTVSRATLHNEDEVREKDVRPGDKVRVVRAGDVIPEIAERVKERGKERGKEFSMPDTCPVCDTKVVREGAYTFCPAGLSCKAQLVGHIIHYVSSDAMDIENLGEKIVQQLVDREMVKDLSDLYRLKKEDFLQLEGFAEKSSQKLVDAIQRSKKPELESFLYALGIRHVGQHIARVLAKKYQDLKALRKAEQEDLEKTQEIGPEIAESVTHYFKEKQNQKIIDRLQDVGVQVQSVQVSESDELEGLTFVFTGELDAFTRDEAKERVEKMGARATSSVSGNTDYLVAGEDPGSKMDDAKKHDVKIIDEKEFKKLLHDSGG
jgi:DNA ligase (NAD+)